MRNINQLLLVIFLFAFLFTSCESDLRDEQYGILTEDAQILEAMGFDITMVKESGETYIIDGDIVVDKSELPLYAQIPQTRQGVYRYTVRKDKRSSILVKIDPSVPSSWAQAAQHAIEAWNGLGTEIEMQITTGSSYDIIVRKGSAFGLGTIAQAQYPLSSGNPGSYVEVNDVYTNVYDVDQLTYTIVHEFGHNLGFVHSNWSISGNVTAPDVTEIPGTPSSYGSFDYQSVMYSHSGGRYWDGCSFTDYDKIAAYYVYPHCSLTISGGNYADANSANTYTVNYDRINPYQIEWNIPSGVQCTYSNNNKTVTLRFPSPGTYDIKYRVTQGTCLTEWETKTVKAVNITTNQWYILNPTVVSNGNLQYDIVFKPTQNYYLSSFYITCLYNGSYDGYYSSEDWEWEYNKKYGIYYPCEIESQYGSMNMLRDIYNATGSTLTINAGEVYSCFVSHHIAAGKTLQDIEYVILYLYDNLKRYRYSNTWSFVY